MKKIVVLSCVFYSIMSVHSQNKNKIYDIRTLAFYNLENLFDTINDPNTNDETSPIMELKTNKSIVYWDKIDKLGSVISQIGFDVAKTGPTLIGVSEIENRAVLEDLIKSVHLKNMNYDIIHYESPDKRGIDVALLYQKTHFKPLHHESFNPNIYRENIKVYTRDQLLVSGYLDNELIHVIVNHWPSRSGGEAVTRSLRGKAAYQNTKIIEQIRKTDPKAKVFILGDFNDDPTNDSFKKVLKTKSNKKEVKEGDLFNPYEDMYRKGFNTLGFRDNIHLFDQIMFTSPALDTGDKDYSTYKMYKSMIFNKHFLITAKGRYKGYPFRSFINGSYSGGYSDHYPVYLYLIKEK